MMKKIWKAILFLLILLCISCVGLYLLADYSFINDHPIDDLDTLLIEETDLPAGWRLEYKIPITGYYDWGKENIMIGFSREPEAGYAGQYLYDFTNSLAAIQAYYSLRKSLPLDNGNIVVHIDYESQIADAWYINCGETDTLRVRCDMLGRYEDFITHFSITSPPEGITLEEVRQILSRIDELMKAHLEK